MKTPTKTLVSYLDQDLLLCPNPSCGHSCTHHDCVETFDHAEDAAGGRHVVVHNGDGPRYEDSPPQPDAQLRVDANLTGNPSARRGGVLIHLWCEGCGERFKIAIAQHKGATLIEVLT